MNIILSAKQNGPQVARSGRREGGREGETEREALAECLNLQRKSTGKIKLKKEKDLLARAFS